MTRTTFAQVHATLKDGPPITEFFCIATPNNRPCSTAIDPYQLCAASDILRKSWYTLTINDVRNVICCLICRRDQRGYTHKDKVEVLWSSELSQFDFNTKRDRSPYSLYNGRESASKKRYSHALPTPPPSSELRATRNAAGLFGTRGAPIPPPNFSQQPPNRHEGSRQPTPVLTDSDDAVGSSDLDSEHDDWDMPDSPSLGRARARTPESEPLDAETAEEDPDDNQSSEPGDAAPVDVLMEPPDTLEASLDLAADSNEPENDSLPPAFSRGEASVWSPWAIRSQVLDVLLEPLPKPDAEGSIYAVKVGNGNTTSIVKIGWTTRKVKRRLKEIAREHGQPIDDSTKLSISNIPLLQLQRLEAVVHADLAFFQLNLSVQNSNGRGQKKHREYFEVDISIAQRTINKWWSRMQDIGLEPGRKLDPEIETAIRLDPALDIERSETGGTAIGSNIWSHRNADHAHRENVWDLVFKQQAGGFKQSPQRSGVSWLFAAGLLLIIPEILGWPPNTSYRVLVLSFSVFKYYRLL